jgi:predicted dinucleotide-binding enzyme
MRDAIAIGVIGGTGHLGVAIGRRLALAGCWVIIGSRSAERAHACAVDWGGDLTETSNVAAAAASDIVTVPFG